MTAYPIDPGAYRLTFTRAGGDGPITAIEVHVEHMAERFALYTNGLLDALLTEARSIGDYAPDMMPSNEAIIRQVMLDVGLDPDEDALANADAMGATLLSVAVDDGENRAAAIEHMARIHPSPRDNSIPEDRA